MSVTNCTNYLIESFQTQSVSEEGNFLITAFKNAKERLHNNILCSQHQDMSFSVEESWREANKKGWDGSSSAPTSHDTLYKALNFVNALPLGFNHMPSIYPEGEGGIAFDWENKRGDSLTVIIRENKLIYSYISNEGDKNRASYRIRDGKMPANIMQILVEMFRG